MARFIVSRDTRSKVAVEADDAQKAQEMVKTGKGDVIDYDETFRASADKRPLTALPTEPPGVAPDVVPKTALRK